MSDPISQVIDSFLESESCDSIYEINEFNPETQINELSVRLIENEFFENPLLLKLFANIMNLPNAIPLFETQEELYGFIGMTFNSFTSMISLIDSVSIEPEIQYDKEIHERVKKIKNLLRGSLRETITNPLRETITNPLRDTEHEIQAILSEEPSVDSIDALFSLYSEIHEKVQNDVEKDIVSKLYLKYSITRFLNNVFMREFHLIDDFPEEYDEIILRGDFLDIIKNDNGFSCSRLVEKYISSLNENSSDLLCPSNIEGTIKILHADISIESMKSLIIILSEMNVIDRENYAFDFYSLYGKLIVKYFIAVHEVISNGESIDTKLIQNSMKNEPDDFTKEQVSMLVEKHHLEESLTNDEKIIDAIFNVISLLCDNGMNINETDYEIISFIKENEIIPQIIDYMVKSDRRKMVIYRIALYASMTGFEFDTISTIQQNENENLTFFSFMMELFNRNYEIFSLGIIDFLKSMSGSQNQRLWMINVMDLMVSEPRMFSDEDFNKILEEDDSLFVNRQDLLDKYAINILSDMSNVPQSKEFIEHIMKFVIETTPSIIKLKLILC